MLASGYGQTDAVRVLIEEGLADMNMQNEVSLLFSDHPLSFLFSFLSFL